MKFCLKIPSRWSSVINVDGSGLPGPRTMPSASSRASLHKMSRSLRAMARRESSSNHIRQTDIVGVAHRDELTRCKTQPEVAERPRHPRFVI